MPCATGGTRVTLTGVPETMLWPLWNRAAEAQRRGGVIEDPMATKLVSDLSYDFAGHFGKPTVYHAIRARLGDDLIRAFAKGSKKPPVVVALGEGLETQFWRIAEPELSWISVDLPDAMRLRQTLLPADARITPIAHSALDEAWMDSVPEGQCPFVSAVGLLMYFEETQVRRLLGKIASRFPGAQIFFDTISPHVSRKTRRGWKITKSYTAPPMPWGVEFDGLADFIDSVSGLQAISVQGYGDVFPERTRLYNLLCRTRWFRNRFGSALVHVQA